MPPKLKSEVWKYFSKVSGGVAECKLCGKPIKTSGNTTNLKGHMKTHQNHDGKTVPEQEIPAKKSHIEKHFNAEPTPSTSSSHSDSDRSTNIEANQNQCDIQSSTPSTSTSCISSMKDDKKKMEDSVQPKITKTFQTIANFEEGGKKHRKITESLVYFICKDNMPLNIVEGTGFKHFLKETVPLYKVPCRNTIKKRIVDKYDATSYMFKEKLSKLNSLVITFDVWTETLQMKSFLGITVHFLEGTKMVASCLDVIELTESHTGEYIKSNLENVLHAWNISLESIQAVVTDNGANMLKAVGNLFGMNKHLSCFAHTINLSVENAIKHSGTDELFTKIRSIVKFFKASTNVSDLLRKEQLKLGIPEGKLKKLILDVCTRWNSKFYMCQRFLELISFVGNILLIRPNSPPMLSANEVELMRELISILEVMEKLTVEVSGDQYVTVSMVIPLINCVIKNISSINVKLPLAISLKAELLKEIDKRFGTREQVNILAIGTILDPRFKNIHFNSPLASSRVLQKINNMIFEQMQNENSTVSEEMVDMSLTESSEVDLWGFHRSLTEKQNMKVKEKNTNTDSLNPEIRLYLSSPLSNLKDNPLEIWEELKNVYPSLYVLARKYLSVVCTSVPSERLFSRAGDTITPKRNRILGKLLSKLLFLGSLPDEFW